VADTPLIEFKKADLGYGSKVVLSGVDLSVHAGDFFGILGHNGSGKTTMLRTLLGLIPHVRGTFAARGRHGGGPRFGYVPQKEKLDAIYPLSSFEVASMGAYRKLELFQTLRGKSAAAHVRKCLKECGALELANRRYSDLSGGQRQRVLIARALAAEPEILVLDEPLSGIDITTQTALLELLKRFKDQRHLTILMVSHRIQREKALFSHVAWCEDGKVHADTVERMLSKESLAHIFESEL
jgi:ABC-type Mn2+/Zn2+ transport system ATPase subunit